MSTHALTHAHTHTRMAPSSTTHLLLKKIFLDTYSTNPSEIHRLPHPLPILKKKIYKPYFLIFRSHLDSLSLTHTQTSSRGPAKISFNLLNSNVLYLEREVAALWVLVRSPFAQPEVTQLLSPAGTFHGPSLTRSLLNDTFFIFFGELGWPFIWWQPPKPRAMTFFLRSCF